MNNQIRWSYGVQLLSKAVPPNDVEHTAVIDNEINLLTDGIEDIESLWREGRHGHGEPVLGYSARNENRSHPPSILQPSPYTSDMSTLPQCSDPGDTPISNPDGGSEHEGAPVPAWSVPAPTFVQRVIRAGGTIWRKTTAFMTPPLWASIISIVIALNKPIQHLFDGFLWPVRGAVDQAGGCSIPITLVVLGAYFHTPADRSAQLSSGAPVHCERASVLSRWRKIFCLHSESQNGAIRLESHRAHLVNRGNGKTIFVAILARMFIVPLLLLPLVVLGALQGSPTVFQE
jgi:predicted permease